jgi:tetratricopeptide (TPR) repeat protein
MFKGMRISRYNVRAARHFINGEFDAALELANAALELDPERATSYLFRANVYIAREQYDKAIADCDQALELGREDGQVRVARGTALTRKGELLKGQVELNEALRLSPKLPEVYFYRGENFFAQQKYKEAADSFLEAEQRGFVHAYPQIGQVAVIVSQYAMGKIEEAQKLWQLLALKKKKHRERAWVLEQIKTWMPVLVSHTDRLIRSIPDR